MGMEVEIEGEDGSKLPLGVGETQNTVFGRGCGFNTKDRTVSRRHVSFQLNNSTHSESEGRVSFEVIGRNPIWLWPSKDQTLRLFRKFDNGHLEFGDRFSLSGKTPIWFRFNKPRLQTLSDEVAEPSSDSESEGPTSRADLDIDQIDLSRIDPVKEFGFVVMGHEFDHYPKGMIRNVKDWEWFLEERSKDSEEEEEDEGKERRNMRRKRKKGKDNEDEEWGGEGEDDKDLVAKIRKVKTTRYSTRSKDSGKGPNRDTKGSSSSSSTSSKRKKATNVNETVEEEYDDDDDETLGGFIIDDEGDDRQGEETDEEEEEEFEDDDDDD